MINEWSYCIDSALEVAYCVVQYWDVASLPEWYPRPHEPKSATITTVQR